MLDLMGDENSIFKMKTFSILILKGNKKLTEYETQ